MYYDNILFDNSCSKNNPFTAVCSTFVLERSLV